MVDVRFAQGVRTGLSVNMGSGMRKMLKQLGLAAVIGSSAVLAGCYDTGDQAVLDELLNVLKMMHRSLRRLKPNDSCLLLQVKPI